MRSIAWGRGRPRAPMERSARSRTSRQMRSIVVHTLIAGKWRRQQLGAGNLGKLPREESAVVVYLAGACRGGNCDNAGTLQRHFKLPTVVAGKKAGR